MLHDFVGISVKEFEVMERAALLELQGKPDEAEATRFAADYHNLDCRFDADGGF